MAEAGGEMASNVGAESPTSPLGTRTMLAYAAASFGTGAFFVFNNAVLPLYLLPLTGSHLLVGLLSSTRSIEGALVQPVVGAWSDRLRTPLGRRRPFIIVGVPLAALVLILTPFAPSLAWMVAAIVVCSFFFNLAVDPYTALLADIAPPRQRGTLSGLATFVQFLPGQVGVALLVAWLGERGQLDTGFALVAVALVLGFAVTLLGVREPARPAVRERFAPREYVASLLGHREALKFFVGFFLFFFGMNAVLPFLTPYATREIGVTEAEALRLFLVPVVITGLLALPMGRLGDRGGFDVPLLAGRLRVRFGGSPAYKQLIGFGVVCLGSAAVLGTWATDVPQLVALLVLAGVGNAALTALWWPQLTQLIPGEQAGVFYGLSATVQSIAFPASVAVGGLLIDVFQTYRAAFVVLAVMSVASLVAFGRISVPKPTPAEA